MTRTPAKFLTTRQLARIWLVSEATIKRWADAGQLKSARTAGGHRRFTVAEVMRFQAERGLGAADGAGSSSQSPAPALEAGSFEAGETAEQFFRAVVRGHTADASALLLESHMLGVPLEVVFDEVVGRALRRVGDAWHAAEMSVAEEHLATATAARAIETLAASTRRARADARVAVCCAAEDELHTLAAHCAQILLEASGWEVGYLGGHTPFFALAEYVAKHRPALVCVSATMQRELEHNVRDYVAFGEAARARGTRVVLGGEGFRGEAVRARFPADLHAESLCDLAAFLKTLD